MQSLSRRTEHVEARQSMSDTRCELVLLLLSDGMMTDEAEMMTGCDEVMVAVDGEQLLDIE